MTSEASPRNEASGCGTEAGLGHGDVESGSQPTDKVWEELRQHSEPEVASRGAILLPRV